MKNVIYYLLIFILFSISGCKKIAQQMDSPKNIRGQKPLSDGVAPYPDCAMDISFRKMKYEPSMGTEIPEVEKVDPKHIQLAEKKGFQYLGPAASKVRGNVAIKILVDLKKDQAIIYYRQWKYRDYTVFPLDGDTDLRNPQVLKINKDNSVDAYEQAIRQLVNCRDL